MKIEIQGNKLFNYLHYGDSLKILEQIKDSLIYTNSKKEFLKYLRNKKINSEFLNDVIKSYYNEYNDHINIKTFKEDVESSLKQYILFKTFGCRGFSYKLINEFDFSYSLDPRINFKIALQTDKTLYYPPRLRKYLPRPHRNHIRLNKYPAIAFALGSIIDMNLFVFVIQSDLFFNGPACIREYLRGWRKILFHEIIENKKDEIENIFLCSAKDLLSACHPDLFLPESTPNIWYDIYDKTASQFNMQFINLETKIDIQTLYDLPSTYVDKMYHFKIK